MKQKTVCQVTSRHSLEDTRILYRMAWTAKKFGYNSIVVGPGNLNNLIEGININILIKIPKNKNIIYRIKVLTVIVKYILTTKFDLYQLHDPDLLFVVILLKLFKKNIVYDIHDDYEASVKDRFRNLFFIKNIFSKLWYYYEYITASFFDGIIVADNHIYNKFKKYKPIILGNYPSKYLFKYINKNNNNNNFVIIYVGCVTEERGIITIIKALKLIENNNIKLHIIGECNDIKIKKMMQSDNRIKYFGIVSWRELPKYYAESHLGIACYQYREGFVTVNHSVKLIEYMASGLPILCSDFPGLVSFIENSKYGITTNPENPKKIAEKIMLFYNNKNIRIQFGKNGRYAFENNYHWEKYENELINMYNEIL